MKKFMSIILVAVMALSLFAACGAPADDGVTKVAIVQQLDHSSLDEIRAAIESELTTAGIEFEVFNGQNDATVLNQIGAQVVSDNFDAIIPIATLAAQCMVTAADGYNIPIIYAACPLTLAMRQKILRLRPFPLPSTAHLLLRFSLRSQPPELSVDAPCSFTSAS